MPELPDVELYLFALEKHFQGQTIEKIVVKSPFVVRSIDIPLEECEQKQVIGFSRIGKRIVWHLQDELFIVFHLMIAGRYHKRKPQALPRSKTDLIAFQFTDSTLMLTEAASKKRASLNVERGDAALESYDRRGLDVLNCELSTFQERLQSQNRTIKRALTDPEAFDGIGNAYSDEILHDAKLSPFARTNKIKDEDIVRLFDSTRNVLTLWIERLQDQTGDKFPEKVTAFRPEMAVHGKYNEPCPVCDSPVQRIRFAEKEWNYCARCQTGGKLLADRSLSRLLNDEWPDTIDGL